MRGPDSTTTHGAAGRGANSRGACASAFWRLGVTDAGRRGADRGRRTADGDSRGRIGGQHECRRALGAAGGARGAQARVRPLQVSAGPGRPGSCGAPCRPGGLRLCLPEQEAFRPRAIIMYPDFLQDLLFELLFVFFFSRLGFSV
jgi:hypothetical protein